MNDMWPDKKDPAEEKIMTQELVEFYDVDDDPAWLEEQRIFLDFGRRCMRQIIEKEGRVGEWDED